MATQLIPKPPGEVGRVKRGGYNLERVLDWAEGEYAKVQKYMRELAVKHLDMSELLGRQNVKNTKRVYDLAKEMYPQLRLYEDDWAIDDFLRMILKNSSTRNKRKSQGGDTTNTRKEQTDEEDQSSGEDP